MSEKTESKSTKENAPKEPKEKVIISGAQYWDFDTNPQFEGMYRGQVIREEDQKVIGFNFEDMAGDLHIISNSHSIEKSLHTPHKDGELYEDPEAVLRILFLGKTEINGKPFNRFKISLLEF